MWIICWSVCESLALLYAKYSSHIIQYFDITSKRMSDSIAHNSVKVSGFDSIPLYVYIHIGSVFIILIDSRSYFFSAFKIVCQPVNIYLLQ